MALQMKFKFAAYFAAFIKLKIIVRHFKLFKNQKKKNKMKKGLEGR